MRSLEGHHWDITHSDPLDTTTTRAYTKYVHLWSEIPGRSLV